MYGVYGVCGELRAQAQPTKMAAGMAYATLLAGEARVRYSNQKTTKSSILNFSTNFFRPKSSILNFSAIFFGRKVQY